MASTNKCRVCTKTVYEQEKRVYDTDVFHITCFRCLKCNTVLSLTNVAKIAGDVYCKPCFKKVFKEKGNYASFGAKTLAANAPMKDLIAAGLSPGTDRSQTPDHSRPSPSPGGLVSPSPEPSRSSNADLNRIHTPSLTDLTRSASGSKDGGNGGSTINAAASSEHIALVPVPEARSLASEPAPNEASTTSVALDDVHANNSISVPNAEASSAPSTTAAPKPLVETSALAEAAATPKEEAKGEVHSVECTTTAKSVQNGVSPEHDSDVKCEKGASVSEATAVVANASSQDGPEHAASSTAGAVPETKAETGDDIVAPLMTAGGAQAAGDEASLSGRSSPISQAATPHSNTTGVASPSPGGAGTGTGSSAKSPAEPTTRSSAASPAASISGASNAISPAPTSGHAEEDELSALQGSEDGKKGVRHIASLSKQFLAGEAASGGHSRQGSALKDPTSNKCIKCEKTVYPMEKQVYDECVYHKTCFKCLKCGTQLSLAIVAKIAGDLYCKPCFKKVFKEKGTYASFGAKTLAAHAPMKDLIAAGQVPGNASSPTQEE